MKVIHKGRVLAQHGPDVQISVVPKPPSVLKRLIARLRVKRG